MPLNSSNALEVQTFLEPPATKPDPSSSKLSYVEEADLRHLRQLFEVKDGGSWTARIPMMDLQNGPPQYRSLTLFKDATIEIVRDFFWDDVFRFKWDDAA